jgi:hypothetical protein
MLCVFVLRQIKMNTVTVLALLVVMVATAQASYYGGMGIPFDSSFGGGFGKFGGFDGYGLGGFGGGFGGYGLGIGGSADTVSEDSAASAAASADMVLEDSAASREATTKQ